MLMIIALDVDLPVHIQLDELAGILVDLDFRRVALIRIMCFYDAYHQPAVLGILDHLAGVPVCHTMPTTAAGLHGKLVPTMRADGLSPLLHIR